MDAATRAAAAACTEPTAARVGEVLVSALDSVMAHTSAHQQGKRAGQEYVRCDAPRRTVTHRVRWPATNDVMLFVVAALELYAA